MFPKFKNEKINCLYPIFFLFLAEKSHETLLKTELIQTDYNQGNCVKSILDHYFGNCLRIVVINIDDYLIENTMKHPIIIRSQTQNIIEFEYLKVCAYIIKVNDTNKQEVFNQLEKDAMWNSRANFLLLAQQQSPNNIFEILSKYYIYNVVVAIEEELFTYFPFIDENVNTPNTVPILLDKCVNGSLTLKTDLFPNKIPKYWRNSTLDAVVQYMLPYTLCLYGCDNKGIEFEVVHFLMDSLKFTVNADPRHFSGE